MVTRRKSLFVVLSLFFAAALGSSVAASGPKATVYVLTAGGKVFKNGKKIGDGYGARDLAVE